MAVVAASLGAATLTSENGTAMAESSSSPETHDFGAAGGPAVRTNGLELAEGAGGESPVVGESPSEDAPAAPLPCPDAMVLVQGEHCFESEQTCLRWDDPEGRPQHRVCAAFQQPSRCASRRHSMRFCIDRDEYVEPGARLPTAGVSWEQARDLCEAAGKRLCTNLEWEFACEGEQSLPYPYGFERSVSLCNQDRVVRDGENARGDLREPPHRSCVSPFGVRDLVGNVDEWVTRPYEKSPHRAELRGGWWMTGRNRCRAATTSHDERYAGRQTGFRCCQDAAVGD